MTVDTEREPPTRAPATSRARGDGSGSRTVRSVAVILMAVIIGGLVGYTTGFLQQRASVRAAEDRAAAMEEEHGVELTRVEQELAETQARLDRLEARRSLHLAALALEAHNYGLAQRHVDHSAALIEGAAGQSEELQELAEELHATNVVVPGERTAQRERLETYIERLDRAVPVAGRTARSY